MNPIRTPRVIVLALLLAVTAVFSPQPDGLARAAEDAPEMFSTDFSAVMKLSHQGELDLELAGKIVHCQPLTRIEFAHPLTRENIVLLLDAAESSAVILYTDTLNGLKYNYSGKYYEEWPAGFARFLSTDTAARPEGWTKTVSDPGAEGFRKVRLTSDDITVECRITADEEPLSMDVATPGHTASFLFSNYQLLKEVDPALFEVPADYAIEEIGTLEDEQALPL